MERRDCQEVIKQMLEVIPKDKSQLRDALLWNYHDAEYKPPEETIQWERTSLTLQKFIPDPMADWEWEVLSIFTTRSIEELKNI